MSKGTVLIVNDSQLVTRYLSCGLRHHGYSVTVARAASEALVLALQCNFQAAIVSSKLPDWDGQEFIRLLRTLEGTRSLPVLLIIDEGHEELLSLDPSVPGTRCVRRRHLTPDKLYELLGELVTEKPKGSPGRHSVFVVSLNKHVHEGIARLLDAQRCDVLLIAEENEALHGAPLISPDAVILHYRPHHAPSCALTDGILANPNFNEIPMVFVTDRSDFDSVSASFASRPHSAFLKTPLNEALLQAQLSMLWETREQRQALRQLETVLGTVAKELDLSRTLLMKGEEEAILSRRYRQNLLPRIGYKLREPVTEIVAFGKALLDLGGLDPKLENGLHAILGNGRQLLRMTEGVFHLVDIERGTLGVEPRLCSTLDIIWKLQDEFHSWMRLIPPRLSIKIRGALPNEITTDPERVFQNVAHLTYNSLKYAPGGTVEVAIEFEQSSARLCISVSDSGPGIPHEKLPNLFELPWHSEDFNFGMPAGLGTGLPFVKYVAEKLGGTLEVHTKEQGTPSQGTVFCLRIPTGVVSECRVDSAALLGGPELESEALQPFVNPQGISGKVLIVEDSVSQQHLYDLYLQRTKVQYQFVETPLRLMEQTAKDSFDLIVLDLDLPGLSSLEISNMLRAKGYTNPIIGVSSLLERDSIKRHSDPACNALLLRPFESQRLYELLSFYLANDLMEQLKRARAYGAQQLIGCLDALPEQLLPEVTAESPELAPMVVEYVDTLPAQLETLEAAISDQDWSEVVNIARRIAGDAGLFGYPVLSNVGQNLMRLATGTPAAGAVHEHYLVLKDICDRIRRGREQLLPKEVVAAPEPQVEQAPPQVPVSGLSVEQQQNAREYLLSFDGDFTRIKTAEAIADWRRVAFVSNELAGAAALCGLKDVCTSLLAIEQSCYAHNEAAIKKELLHVELLVSQYKRALHVDIVPSSSAAQAHPGAAPSSGAAAVVMMVSELAASDPTLVPLIEDFLGELEGIFARLQKAADSQAWEELGNVAHEMAGTAGMYGYPQCRMVAKELQGAAKDRATVKVPVLLTQLRSIVAAMLKGKSALRSGAADAPAM